MKKVVYILVVIAALSPIHSEESNEETALEIKQDVSLKRVSRQTDTRTQFKESFNLILDITEQLTDFIPNPKLKLLAEFALPLARFVFELLFDALWPTNDGFQELNRLISIVRKEIDDTISRETENKIISYSRRLDRIISELYESAESRKTYHNGVVNILLGQQSGDEKYRLIQNLTEWIGKTDNLKEVRDSTKSEIIALEVVVDSDRSEFVHKFHPSSTAIQYSRFALIDVMLKTLRGKMENREVFFQNAKDSARKHADYLWKSAHWLASEKEVDSVAQTSKSTTRLEELGKKPYGEKSVYTEEVTKLSADLGIQSLLKISGMSSTYAQGDYISHGDAIALRSSIQPHKYVSIAQPGPFCQKQIYICKLALICDVDYVRRHCYCQYLLQPCSGGEVTPFRTKESNGNFLCSERIFKIYSETKGPITSGSKIALAFQQTRYLSQGIESLCQAYSGTNLEDGNFDDITGNSVLVQYIMYAAGKGNGEKILARDRVLITTATGKSAKVLSVKNVEKSNEDLTLLTDESQKLYKDTFRIFKYNSNADPGHYDPDQVTSGAITQTSSLKFLMTNCVCYFMVKYF